jgi:hypothetical protein
VACRLSHLKTIVSVDFFTVPTIRFQMLYVFLVLAHDRRRILYCAVTDHPTAEWTAQQLREAFPGVLQIDAKLPGGIQTGGAVSVAVAGGNISSQAGVTIALQSQAAAVAARDEGGKWQLMEQGRQQ